MNWKHKASIQNLISNLPNKLSYELYFLIQRYFGEYKKPFNSISHFEVGAKFLRTIQSHGHSINDKTFFEVGTGRIPILPIVFWLCGANKTITVDLNPYLRDTLLYDMLYYIRKDEAKINIILEGLINKDRFDVLRTYSKMKKIERHDFFRSLNIEYIAPGDASKMFLMEKSIDYHISYTVYEHIPMSVLNNILVEGNRIIKDDGLFINCIDYGDHFSYSDKYISSINFLQYSDRLWDKYANNKYMYMNRARHDDYLELFFNANHEVIEVNPHIEPEIKKY
jgi:hypothetical protein